jgi:lysophospholipase L1-like esterase
MKGVFKFLAAAAVFAGVAVSDSTSFKVHVIGDSTVCNYKDNAYPQTGWGQILGSFFDGTRVQVVNYAIGGRSSKTFVQEGRLDEVKKNLQKGDVMMVQFGHNDRYFGSKAREVPFDSLGYWLQQYADVAKGAGVTLVYVTPMNMNMGANGRNIFTEYNVVGKMEELAKKNGAVYVNLNAKSYNAYSKSWDPAYVSRYQFKMFLPGEYPNYPDGVTNDGTTHFQESGSIAHCQWIAEELESALKNESYISADNKANLTQLVSALKPRYAFTVKANVSNSKGLITHNQQLPGGAPLTLHVSPGSFGKKFVGWYDDDCNKLSADSNYYGQKTLYRATTYTAVFDGGPACEPTAHGEEQIGDNPTSSSSVGPESSASIDTALCFTGVADEAWPSPIDMASPEAGDGWTEANHEGFTGQGFFNFDNSAYSTATYNVTSDQSASNARVMIRYSFQGNTDRDMKLTVDNGEYDVTFKSTGSWDKWDTAYVEDVWVDALDFKVKLASASADGGPNIDMIAFDIKGVYRTGCSPAKVKGDAGSSSSSESSSSESGETIAFDNHTVAGFHFDAARQTVTTSGGLLKVQIVDALGKMVAQEVRQVAPGTVPLLQKDARMPYGRYFVRVQLDGRVVMSSFLYIK